MLVRSVSRERSPADNAGLALGTDFHLALTKGGCYLLNMRQDGQPRPQNQDNTSLTFQLFEQISSFHSVPRLRQRLARVHFANFESHVPLALEKDLIYLISGLNAQLDLSLDPSRYPNLPLELGEYLRHCDNYGLTIHHFLTRSAKSWEDIRPKYQQLCRTQLADALRQRFPELSDDRADFKAAYLLVRSLARLLPPFPFSDEPGGSPLAVNRTQADLHWNLVAEPVDLLSTLQTHFPETDWQSDCRKRNLWFVGVRLLSVFSPRTASVLSEAFADLSHLATSRVRSRRKLLLIAFFSEGDVGRFKFNLQHHAKMAGTFYEFCHASLAEFREGYPGLSGFIEEEMRHEMTARGK